MRYQVVSSGFTMIELTISLGLGSLIVLVSVAGLRSASQVNSYANRLSQENAMIRAGVYEAHQQLDYWTNLHDPQAGDGRRTALAYAPITTGGDTYSHWIGQESWGRAPVAGPFTPLRQFKTAGPISSSMVPNDPWRCDDPKTWPRGNMIQRTEARYFSSNPSRSWSDGSTPGQVPISKYGYYNLFNSAIDFQDKRDRWDVGPTTTPVYSPLWTYGKITPSWRWYPQNMMARLGVAGGLLGLFEYTPSNMIFQVYSGSFNSSSGVWWSNEPNNWNRGSSNGRSTPWYLLDSTIDQCVKPAGTYESNLAFGGPLTMSMVSSASLVNPCDSSGNVTIVSSDAIKWQAVPYPTDPTVWTTSVSAAADRDKLSTYMKDFFDRSLRKDMWLLSEANKPERWLAVTTSTARHFRQGAFVNIARISWMNPLTGESSDLFFTGYSTTLRGARQQRHQNGTQWAAWDNGPLASIDPHLDNP